MRHLVEAVHASRGFFRDAFHAVADGAVETGLLLQILADGVVQRLFFLVGMVGDEIGIVFRLRPKHAQQGRVATVVEDHVGVLAVGPSEDAVGVVPVFFQRLALGGEHRRAGGGDRRGGVILRREDVA